MPYCVWLRVAIVAALISGAVEVSVAQATYCTAPPSGSGGDWFRSYQQWCTACGGRPSANASPAICTPGPTWGGTGAGGGYTPREQAAMGLARVGGHMLGQALSGMIFGSPQDAARRQMEAEAARERAEAERLAREAELEARKQRLLSEMQGLDRGPDLALMLDSDGDQLSLMLGDKALIAQNRPKAEPVSYQLNRGWYLYRQVWQAQTPEQAAELADAAFEASVGGIVDAAKVPAQAVTAPVDGSLEQQFKDLREHYFKSRNEAYPKVESWLQLEEQRSLAQTVREDAERKLGRAGAPAEEMARLRTLRDEAAAAEAKLAEQIAQARRAAAASQQAVIESGQALRDFLGTRRAPAPPHTSPPVVHLPLPSPYTPPASGSGAPASPSSSGSPSPPAPPSSAPQPGPQSPKDHPYYVGFLDGVQCCAANTGPSCGGLTGNQFQDCVNTYRSGYKKGEQIKQGMIAQAAALGRQDRDAGRRHSAFTNPNAAGPCRIAWIEAYTDGYQRSNPPVFR